MSVCHLFPGYGIGTPYTWGMGKREAGSLARKTFLTFSFKNRHGMASPFPTNIVLKMPVSRKYNFFIHFSDRVLVFDVFLMQDKSMLKFVKIDTFVLQISLQK